MPPEVGASIVLTNQTCRLCLANVDDLLSLECSLTPNELSNVIGKFLDIDLEENWPFQNGCQKCIMKVRMIENIRSSFEEKNRLFDVLWTQYKRIHLQSSLVNTAKPTDTGNDGKNVTAGYIIGGVVVEKTEVEIVPPEELLKADSNHHESLIKQEDLDPDDPGLELVYEEMTLEETDFDDNELIEEDDIEGELIVEHIVEEDDENLQDTTEDNSEHNSNDECEVAEIEEVFNDGEGCFDPTLNRCYVCMETLESEEMLQDHLETVHHNLLPFHCDKCLAYFDTIEEVNRHLTAHQYPFVCLYCPRKYSSEALLLEHNKTCCAYRCPYCTAEFEVMAHLTAHKKQHTAQLRALNQCKTCGRTFTQASNLQRHVRSRRCGSTEPGPRLKRGRKSVDEWKLPVSSGTRKGNWEAWLKSLLICQVCNRKFDSNSHLARHIERDHAEFSIPLFACDACPKKFTAFDKCIRHRTFHRRSKKKAKTVTEKKDGKSDTMCKICNKQFRVEHQLLRHLAEEHSLSLELFQCDQCERKFSTELKLRKHQYNSHRQNKTLYVCSHCGQKFEKKLTLKDHETKHLGTPAYKCELCEKTFIHKHSLDRHALVHSDVKEFACDICSKTFKRNTTLVIHRRIHTGEKPYHCAPCGQHFIDSSTLIKHRQRVHAKAD